jgi:hypothetical protein
MEVTLKNINHVEGKKNPKIYSIHSQKGGVGKTSIAIAIAGLEAIFNGKKVLLIDADLTGTSIKDVLERKDEKAPYKYINNVILAAPDEFMNYTPLITKRTKRKSTSRGLAGFYFETEINPKIFFSPSSPDYNDVLEIIPLISQEDYLHFFRHRFEDIIVTAFNDGFEVIIIDLSSGFHGLSKNICDMMLEQIIQQINKKEGRTTEDTRLDILFNSSPSNYGLTIEPRVVFVTTSDKPDYRGLVPLYCSYVQQTLQKNNNFSYEKFQGTVDIIFNKLKSKGGEPIDPPIAMGEILDDLENNFKDYGEQNIFKNVIETLRKRTGYFGAYSCENIPPFRMEDVLRTIKNLSTPGKDDIGTQIREDISGWCINISKALTITSLKDIPWAKYI